VVLAGGQAELAGKIFRIGHMGRCTEDEIQGVLDALKKVLPQVGFAPAAAGRR
jgi:aspartate aminotransferase-like enzyme